MAPRLAAVSPFWRRFSTDSAATGYFERAAFSTVTCNYILSNMEANGTTLVAALAQAKKLGYAESDPSDDVSGLDAASKLAIAARAGFRAELNAFDVPRRTIKGIKPADFGYARQLG